jgi:hypothetical protein
MGRVFKILLLVPLLPAGCTQKVQKKKTSGWGFKSEIVRRDIRIWPPHVLVFEGFSNRKVTPCTTETVFTRTAYVQFVARPVMIKDNFLEEGV